MAPVLKQWGPNGVQRVAGSGKPEEDRYLLCPCTGDTVGGQTGRGDGELWRVLKEGHLQHLSTGCIMARSRYWGAMEAGRGRVCSELKQWTCPVRM